MGSVESKLSVSGAGLFALDTIITHDAKFVRTALGGTAGNVLAILSNLGWRATIVGAVGKDAIGVELVEKLRSQNIESGYLSLEGPCTPIVYHYLVRPGDPAKFHRFSFGCPHCGRRCKPADQHNAAIGERMLADNPAQDVFFFDRATALAVDLATSYRRAEALVVFEPSDVGPDAALFERAMAAAHVVKYSADRLESIGVQKDWQGIEIQTLGEKGIRYRSGHTSLGWKQFAAFENPNTLDTSGAGDWCTAGIIHKLVSIYRSVPENIKDFHLLEAILFGQALASLGCSAVGALGLLDALPVTKAVELAYRLVEGRKRWALEKQERPGHAIEKVEIEDVWRQLPSQKKQLGLVANSFPCCGSS